LGDVKTPAPITGGPGRASRVWGYCQDGLIAGSASPVREIDGRA
jgi:hypothetical protein